MRQQAFGILLLLILLAAAGGFGYWDMQNSVVPTIVAENGTADTGTETPRAGEGRAARPTGAEPDGERAAIGDRAGAPLPPTSSSAGTPSTAAAEEASASGADVDAAEKDRAGSTQPIDAPPQGRDDASITGDGQAPATPGFDILRVEPDGSAVVAGRSSPGAAVVLDDAGEEIGRTTANAAGEFVVVLEKPLPPGSHEITLTQTAPGGETSVSAEVAVVDIPQPGREHELLAMVTKQGEPSRLIALPRSADLPSGSRSADGATSDKEARPSREGSLATGQMSSDPSTEDDRAGGDRVEDGDVLPADVAASPATTTAEDGRSGPPESPLRVEAVEVDAQNVYVAGSAEAGSRVRIYVDDSRLAEARASDGNRFYVTGRQQMSVGQHTVRADQLDADGTVVARVEVPFDRPIGASASAVAEASPPARDAAEPPSTTASRASRATGAAPAASGIDRGRDGGPEPGRAIAAGTLENGAVTDRTAASASPSAATEPRVAAADPGSAAGEASRMKNPPGDAEAKTRLADVGVPATAYDGVRADRSSVVETTRQDPLTPVEGRVIIRRGDNLWNISRMTYGEGRRFTVIYLANDPQIRDPDLIYPGQIFRLPRRDGAEFGEALKTDRTGGPG